MKIPQTNLEQKCWIVTLVFVISIFLSIILNIEEYAKWFSLIGVLSLTVSCIISKKKNWISKENKL